MAKSGGRKRAKHKGMQRGSFSNRNEAHARRSNIYRHILQTRVPEASLWALLAARLAPSALPVSNNYLAPSLRTD